MVGIGKIILNFEVILHFPAIQMFLFLFEFPTLSKFLIQNFKKSSNFKIILPNSVPYHINPVFYYYNPKNNLNFLTVKL